MKRLFSIWRPLLPTRTRLPSPTRELNMTLLCILNEWRSSCGPWRHTRVTIDTGYLRKNGWTSRQQMRPWIEMFSWGPFHCYCPTSPNIRHLLDAWGWALELFLYRFRDILLHRVENDIFTVGNNGIHIENSLFMASKPYFWGKMQFFFFTYLLISYLYFYLLIQSLPFSIKFCNIYMSSVSFVVQILI